MFESVEGYGCGKVGYNTSVESYERRKVRVWKITRVNRWVKTKDGENVQR